MLLYNVNNEITIHLERKRGSTRKPSNLNVRPEVGLGEGDHVSDVEKASNVNKVLHHVLRPRPYVGRSKGLHDASKVLSQFLKSA